MITPTAAFSDILSAFETFESEQKERAKFDMEHVLRKDKKAQQQFWDEKLGAIADAITVAKEAIWLYEKFGEGEYRDIPGLCKVAIREEVKEKNYSLTPGAYVGVAAVETEKMDFTLRMQQIHRELLTLQGESNTLMQTISDNMKEMGI